MANEYQIVRDYAMGLAPGSTDNGQICPKCRGGSSHDKAFAITRAASGEVLFKCHRASCGFGGVLRSHAQPSEPRRSPFVPRQFGYPTRELDAGDYKFFWDRFQLPAEHISRVAGWSYCPERCRYVYTVFGPHRECRGVVARSYRDGVRPKVDTFREAEGPFLSWYYPPEVPSLNLLCVEDIVSAVKAAQYTTAVALGGTHLSEEMVWEITRIADDRPILLALDQDATTKAVKFAKKYALWGNFQVIPLSKDIKDTPNDVIKRIVYAFV